MTNDFNTSNLDDFYRRIGFIEREHAAGRGFDAPGTLGRSHFPKSLPGVGLALRCPQPLWLPEFSG
jgi:hypothetical protein